MQRLEVSGAVQLIYRSLGVKGLIRLFGPLFEPEENMSSTYSGSEELTISPCSEQ